MQLTDDITNFLDYYRLLMNKKQNLGIWSIEYYYSLLKLYFICLGSGCPEHTLPLASPCESKALKKFIKVNMPLPIQIAR